MIHVQGNKFNLFRSSAMPVDTPRAGKLPGSDRMGNMVNQDKIAIHADSRQIAEREFARRIADEILLETRQDVPSERISELEKRIAAGTYQVDAAAAVEKIFRFGGPAADGQTE